MQKEDGNVKVEVDLFQSLKLFFDDVRSDYSGIDMEALILSTSVEQPPLRWGPWDLFGSFKVCSDAKERVGCRKKWEATAPIHA